MTAARGSTQRKEAPPAAIPIELDLSEAKLIKAFRRLSPERRADLLAKLQALREPILRTAPASKLYNLTALVSLGGDALADAEALYDDHGGH